MLSALECLAPDAVRRLTTIAKRFDRIVVRYRTDVCDCGERWLDAHDLVSHNQNDWRKRRCEYGRQHVLAEGVESATAEVFGDWGSADNPRGFCEFPERFQWGNEPSRPPLPLPCATNSKVTIDEQIVALAAIRDEMLGGECVVPEPTGPDNLAAYARWMPFRRLREAVATLTVDRDTEEMLSDWCRDAEQEIRTKAVNRVSDNWRIADERFTAICDRLKETARSEKFDGFTVYLEPYTPSGVRPPDRVLPSGDRLKGFLEKDPEIRELRLAQADAVSTKQLADEMKLPDVPFGWKGNYYRNVTDVSQLRDYVRNSQDYFQLLLDAPGNGRLLNAANVLMNSDLALATWNVADRPQLPEAPNTADEAERQIRRLLRWLDERLAEKVPSVETAPAVPPIGKPSTCAVVSPDAPAEQERKDKKTGGRKPSKANDQWAKFSKPRRERDEPMTWSAIYQEWKEKNPHDEKAGPDAMRLAYERRNQADE